MSLIECILLFQIIYNYYCIFVIYNNIFIKTVLKVIIHSTAILYTLHQ